MIIYYLYENIQALLLVDNGDIYRESYNIVA